VPESWHKNAAGARRHHDHGPYSIGTATTLGRPDISAGATFWMPKREDIGEEGIEDFRGT
jgi:hypothetical protein